MSRAFKCDKCGQHQDGDAYTLRELTKVPMVGGQIEEKKFDLCSECQKLFKTFMRGAAG